MIATRLAGVILEVVLVVFYLVVLVVICMVGIVWGPEMRPLLRFTMITVLFSWLIFWLRVLRWLKLMRKYLVGIKHLEQLVKDARFVEELQDIVR